MPPATAFAKLNEIIVAFREIDEYVTPQMIQVFLLVAQQPGLTAQQLAKETGLHLSTISRNLTALGEWHRLGKPGLNLIENVEDPHERRRRIAFLTVNGRNLAKRVLQTLDPEIEFDAPLAREWLNKAYASKRS